MKQRPQYLGSPFETAGRVAPPDQGDGRTFLEVVSRLSSVRCAGTRHWREQSVRFLAPLARSRQSASGRGRVKTQAWRVAVESSSLECERHGRPGPFCGLVCHSGKPILEERSTATRN